MLLLQLEAYFCSPGKVPDPVALYPLDGAHGTKEINNRVGAGVAIGVHTAPGPDGKPDGSHEFSGTANSYIEFPNGGGLDVKNSMTMLCWLYPDGQDGPLFNYGKNGSWGVNLWVWNGKLLARFIKRDYSLTKRLDQFRLKPEDGWKFVGASYDQANGHAKLWVDGKVVQTVNIDANLQLATQDSVRMGVTDDDVRDTYRFKGTIAQMQVYNIALTQEQIKVIKDRT